MTSPAGRFVDIRILRPHDLCVATPNPPFAALLQEANDAADKYQSPALDWAFAGTSTRTVTRHAISATGEGELSRAQWTHSIDSLEVDAAQVDDQGDCRVYFNSELAVMMEEELGEGRNPATGEMQVYRETWALPEPDFLSSKSPAQRVCYVLQLDEPSQDAKGLLVRVGAWVQGIVRRGEHVSTVRQHVVLHDDGSESVDQDIRVGPNAHEFPAVPLADFSPQDGHDKWVFVERTTW